MNTFGIVFRVSLFGESHGPAIGVTIDGCIPGIPLKTEDFESDLARRKSGRKGTTPRKEGDIPEIIGGVKDGFTTGAPITVITRNAEMDSSAYDDSSSFPRPGHADFVSGIKYSGFSDHRGGGHFSGRITWGLVVAGVIAKKILHPVNISAKLIEAGGLEDIALAVDNAMKSGDTIGGIIECRVENPPVGLGEPFFYSAESAISQIIFSIPAVKGIEFGSGFASAKLTGSEHNDPFIDEKGKTASNNAGGINGGITNGNELIFRIVIKPTSSTGIEQRTFDFGKGEMSSLKVTGRHDSCIALRIPVIAEAAAAIALCDLFMTDRGIHGCR
ncbi:MAG: chorismate synthase [Odoribacter sp.]|nr:chorismate synthase [Odoribacter sp.]